MVNIEKLHADIDNNINIGTSVVIDDAEQCKRILKNSSSDLRILTQNIRSINRNFDELMVLLERLAIEQDVIILTECWLSKVNILPTMKNYHQFYTKQNLNKNDGVVMYIKKSLNVKVTEPVDTKELTCLVASFDDIVIIGAYRPPEFTKLDNFTQSLEKIFRDFDQSNIILMGDLNIDIKDGYDSTKGDNYLDLAAMYGLRATHNFLTTDKSCLDHCLAKTKLPITTVVCQSTLTDHACVIVSLSQESIKQHSKIRYNKKIDYDSVIRYLKNIKWQEILHNKDANDATNIFLEIVMNTLNLYNTSLILSNRKRNI